MGAASVNCSVLRGSPSLTSAHSADILPPLPAPDTKLHAPAVMTTETAPPPGHEASRDLLKEWIVVTLGAAASALAAEPLAELVGVRTGVVQLFICLLVLTLLLVWNLRTAGANGRASLLRFVGLVIVASLTLTFFIFGEPLKRQLTQVLAASGPPLMTAMERRKQLRTSLSDVVHAREVAAEYGRNDLLISELTADFVLRGRNATFWIRGVATPLDKSGRPSEFFYTLCSDAASVDQELAPHMLRARFGPDLQALVEARPTQVSVPSDSPLAFLYTFSLPAPTSLYAPNGSFRFEIAGCWPGSVWRLLDLALLDTRSLGLVRGNITATFLSPYPIRVEHGSYTPLSMELDIDVQEPETLTGSSLDAACVRSFVTAGSFPHGRVFRLTPSSADEITVFQISRSLPTPGPK